MTRTKMTGLAGLALSAGLVLGGCAAGGASDEHGLVTPLVSRRGHRFNLGRNLVAIQLNTIINIA